MPAILPTSHVDVETGRSLEAVTTLAGDGSKSVPMQPLLQYFKAMINPGLKTDPDPCYGNGLTLSSEKAKKSPATE
jgi:hypothetical protein